MELNTRPLIIRGLSTISAVGLSHGSAPFRTDHSRAPSEVVEFGNPRAVFPFCSDVSASLSAVAQDSRYERLDRVTHAAILASRATLSEARSLGVELGCITIGSSRGPTASLESTVRSHLSNEGRVPSYTSPTTTAGNISSWVAQEYIAGGACDDSIVAMTTSMTCSSAFHSLLVARGFVASGMCAAALFGGAEACLTPYTLAQLEALRIYSVSTNEWPCRPCMESPEVSNAVVLGEGAGSAILMSDDGRRYPGDLEVLGLGWAMEEIPSATGISSDGAAFEAAMRMAVAQLPAGRRVDGVVLHAPGSRRGDDAELQAVERVAGDAQVLSTKHLTGHTYAASGMVSLALAQALLYGAEWSGFPYSIRGHSRFNQAPQVIAVNTAGFGGNAITVIVGRPRLGNPPQ